MTRFFVVCALPDDDRSVARPSTCLCSRSFSSNTPLPLLCFSPPLLAILVVLRVYAKVRYRGEVPILSRQIVCDANVEQGEKKQICKLYDGLSMYWLEFQKNVQGQQPAVLVGVAQRRIR
jgi:hypothetical protein